MVAQSQPDGTGALFTHLEDFQRSQARAEPYMAITIFKDLLASKELALVRAEYDKNKLSKEDATHLIKDFLRSYVDTALYKWESHPFLTLRLAFAP
jgi:hypothetical protein